MLTDYQIDLFYNSIFSEDTAFDLERFDYPKSKFSNIHFLDIASHIFKSKLVELKNLPSWLLLIGMAKLSYVNSNENLTLGEIISSGFMPEDRLLIWLKNNEDLIDLFWSKSGDDIVKESCRVYWDNLNTYGDLSEFCANQDSLFKIKLKVVLEKVLKTK